MRAGILRLALGFSSFLAVASSGACACSDPASTNGSTGGGGGSGYIPPGGGPTTVAPPSAIQAACSAQCAWSTRCGMIDAPDAGGQCVPACVDKLGKLANSLRLDVVRELSACYGTLGCGHGDDSCTTTAITKIGLAVDAAIHAADVQACLTKQAACKGGPGAFSDDTCGTLVMLVDSARATASACFAGACAGIPACLEPIFGN